MFLGLILILIGGLFLLRNLGLLPIETWPILWPSFLVLAGICLIFLSQRVQAFWKKFWDRLWGKIE